MKNGNQKYLDGLRNGDEKVIRQLYKKNLPTVINWIKTKGGSDTDAHDIFQDAMEAVLALSFKEDFVLTSSLDGLIIKICKNKWIDQIRKFVKEERVRNDLSFRLDHEEDYVEIGDDILSVDKVRLMLDETFALISPLCQKVLKLVENGLDAQEIADTLNMSNANTVYRRKFACLEAWRKHIENHPHYETWKNTGL